MFGVDMSKRPVIEAGIAEVVDHVGDDRGMEYLAEAGERLHVFQRNRLAKLGKKQLVDQRPRLPGPLRENSSHRFQQKEVVYEAEWGGIGGHAELAGFAARPGEIEAHPDEVSLSFGRPSPRARTSSSRAGSLTYTWAT
jgi:hypothetical protein